MIVGIPVYQKVDLLDATAPREVFKWMDADLDLRLFAASIDDPVETRDGFRFLTTHTFAEAPRLDVLWVPGGDPAALAKMIGAATPHDYLEFLVRVAAQA